MSGHGLEVMAELIEKAILDGAIKGDVPNSALVALGIIMEAAYSGARAVTEHEYEREMGQDL